MGTAMESRGTRVEEMADQVGEKRGCFSSMPCFGSNSVAASAADDKQERWWSKGWNALLKIKEWSEMVVGPRLKNLFRRFKKNTCKNGCGDGGGGGCGNGGGGELGLNGKGKFQYDPLSYALNFDEGPAQSDEPDRDFVYRDFSFRYASIPISAKSSMDLGKDGPSFS